MSGRISLALALHNHQPVGNFGWVFADVYERAYEPLVGLLERRDERLVRLPVYRGEDPAEVADGLVVVDRQGEGDSRRQR